MFAVVMNSVTLCIWTLDIFASLITGFHHQVPNQRNKHLKEDVLEMRFSRILIRYLRGNFVIDLVVVGLDWLSTFAGDSASNSAAGTARLAKMVRMIRILRVLRLLRLAKLRTLIMQLQDRIDSEYVSVVAGMAKNMVFIIAICHAIACLFYLVGSMESGWVQYYEMGAADASLRFRYISTLLWAICQFTPGGSALFPQTFSEKLYGFAVLVFALFAFSSIVGSITTAMTSLRGMNAKNEADLWVLRKFLKQHAISPPLQARILRYVKFSIEHKKKLVQQDGVELLHLLSDSLQHQLQGEVFMPVLVLHPFFYHFNRQSEHSCRHMCAKAVAMKSFSERDFLFNAGNTAIGMIFIERGELQYCEDEGDPSETGPNLSESTTKTLSAGDWCCEAVMWMRWVHMGDLKALSECTVLIITSELFRSTLVTHPVCMDFVRRYARCYMEVVTCDRLVSDVGLDCDRTRMIMQDILGEE